MNEALVTDNIGLVHFFARPFRHRQDYEDIISAGICGLAKAATLYEDAKGAFSTYAMHWIKTRILRYVSDLAPTVRGTVNSCGKDRPNVGSLNVDFGETGSCWIESIPDGYDYSGDLCGDDLVRHVHRIIAAATDIPAEQKAALMAAINGEKTTQKAAEALCRFRQCTAPTARKIKELLHDHLTA